MRVLLVDWLGRGGIAQCTEAWAIELAARGHEISIACPPDREIATFVLPLELKSGRLRRHRSLVQAVVEFIRTSPPDVVILNNYLIPVLEAPIAHEARRRGVRLISVVHNVVPHSRATALVGGLKHLLDVSSDVVVHSLFEERRLIERTGIRPTVVPLPVQIGMVRSGLVRNVSTTYPPTICQFGVMKRRYKGAEIMSQIARIDHDPWKLRAIGTGASTLPQIESVTGFLPAADFVGLVASSSVAIFPYRHATQSGGIVLAKALGTVPVATAVGGLSEQITGGRSGLLIDAAATARDWLRVLEPLQDEGVRIEMGMRAQREAQSEHMRSVGMIDQLIAS